MVDVAAAAGVSRQTLYNEFGSKEGLARALVRREADGYLAGVERALAAHGRRRASGSPRPPSGPSGRPRNALVRAMLTGCWSERLPSPTLTAVPLGLRPVPAQRRADGPLPSPADFVALVRDRAVAALAGPGTARSDAVELARSCELAVRLAAVLRGGAAGRGRGDEPGADRAASRTAGCQPVTSAGSSSATAARL